MANEHKIWNCNTLNEISSYIEMFYPGNLLVTSVLFFNISKQSIALRHCTAIMKGPDR